MCRLLSERYTTLETVMRLRRQRPARSEEDSGGLLKLGIGSHTENNLHAFGYSLNNGVWGGMVIKFENHPCTTACVVKTELIAIATALTRIQTFEHLTIATSITPVGNFLAGLQRVRRVPQFGDSSLEDLVTKQFQRLVEASWRAITGDGSGSATRTIAHHLHKYALSGQTTITPAQARDCSELAARAFSR